MPGPGDLPSFDRTVVAVLGFVGIGGSVLALVGFALALQSWYDGARLLAGGVRQAGGLVRRAAGIPGVVRVRRPLVSAVGVLVVLLVPVAQVLCLGLCYLGGNYMSIVVADDREARGMKLGELFLEHGAGALWPSRFAEGLELDRIAGTYLVIAVGCLLLSYVVAAHDGDPRALALALLLGVPALVTLALAILAIVLLGVYALLRLAWLLVTAVFTDADFRDWMQDQTVFLPFLGVAVLCLLYVWACYAALDASRIPVAVLRGGRVTPAG